MREKQCSSIKLQIFKHNHILNFRILKLLYYLDITHKLNRTIQDFFKIHINFS